MRLLLALLACLLLAACANADGSRPRLASDAPASAAGFNGGYAGTNYGFSNLNTKSAPF
ncbi:hypothetical protein [Lichenibacterium minor]|uniref:hypothetical protein n=1 Tax=Lichenibacterium minor TaxID=2316528 RepID=UPI0013ECE8FB|nr:hypothetical protein [Lichenibacterium minor]